LNGNNYEFMRQTLKILTLSLFFITVFFIFANFASAALLDTKSITVQVAIPGQENTSFTDFGQYMRAIFSFILGAVGILATVVIMFAGFLWMTARGNAEQVGRAKGYMSGAVLGVVLALGSYFILYIINPKLVEMQFPTSQLKVPVTKTSDASCTGTRICCCMSNGQSTTVACDKDCTGAILNCTDIVKCNEGMTSCQYNGFQTYTCH
jgi:hypothetical protein